MIIFAFLFLKSIDEIPAQAHVVSGEYFCRKNAVYRKYRVRLVRFGVYVRSGTQAGVD